MIKKIMLITLFVLFAGILIYGAVNRTRATSEKAGQIGANTIAASESMQHSEQDSYGQGQGQGQGNQSQGQAQGGQGQGSQGQGQGNQSLGQGQGGQGRYRQEESAELQEWVTITGAVIQAPKLGVDLILETTEGEVLIGTGPGYLAEQGFTILVGDSLSVDGVWENDEFKAAEITLLPDGQSIVLRDAWGRPMWSGAGRNAQNRQNQQDGV